MTADAILYTVADVRTNPPAQYRGGDTRRTATGVIRVLPVPSLDGLQISGASVILNGRGAAAGSGYYVLASTNLALPLANWTLTATGIFDLNGSFLLTNGINPSSPQQFFRLQFP